MRLMRPRSRRLCISFRRVTRGAAEARGIFSRLPAASAGLADTDWRAGLPKRAMRLAGRLLLSQPDVISKYFAERSSAAKGGDEEAMTVYFKFDEGDWRAHYRRAARRCPFTLSVGPPMPTPAADGTHMSTMPIAVGAMGAEALGLTLPMPRFSAGLREFLSLCTVNRPDRSPISRRLE